jgi:hypothetical protein
MILRGLVLQGSVMPKPEAKTAVGKPALKMVTRAGFPAAR